MEKRGRQSPSQCSLWFLNGRSREPRVHLTQTHFTLGLGKQWPLFGFPLYLGSQSVPDPASSHEGLHTPENAARLPAWVRRHCRLP